MSVLGELAQDGGEVDPDILALDVAAFGKLDDVQQADFQRAVAAVET
jgi:hypothetical protein